jgi:uncharacterized membrane protein YoaK (UPF0700 family)
MRIPIAPLSGVLLAFVAGYVDTATFLRVSELFSAHITGNFVVFAIALVHGVRGVDWLKLIALPVFFVGVPLATLVYDRSRQKIRTVLAIESSLLISVGIIEFLPHSPAYDAGLAMLLVLAMAMQNAAHQVEPGLGPNSAVMTTNAARLFVALWRKASPPPSEAAPVKAKGIGARLVCFALGCVVSAFAANSFGLAAVLLPGLVVAFVALFHEP